MILEIDPTPILESDILFVNAHVNIRIPIGNVISKKMISNLIVSSKIN
jgi:hypothetical protein